jgi:hypothetical protein
MAASIHQSHGHILFRTPYPHALGEPPQSQTQPLASISSSVLYWHTAFEPPNASLSWLAIFYPLRGRPLVWEQWKGKWTTLGSRAAGLVHVMACGRLVNTSEWTVAAQAFADICPIHANVTSLSSTMPVLLAIPCLWTTNTPPLGVEVPSSTASLHARMEKTLRLSCCWRRIPRARGASFADHPWACNHTSDFGTAPMLLVISLGRVALPTAPSLRSVLVLNPQDRSPAASPIPAYTGIRRQEVTLSLLSTSAHMASPPGYSTLE